MWNTNALFGLECNRFLYFHCFTKCGISSENRERAFTNEGDPFKELKNKIDQLRESHTKVVLSKITIKDLVDVDDKVLTTEPFTDEGFLADFRELQVEQNNSNNKKDNNDAVDEPVKCKKKNELLDGIDLLQTFSLSVDEGSVVHAICNQLQCKVNQNLM